MRILLVSRIAAASSVNRITASASAKTKASNRINIKTNGKIIVTTTKFLIAVVVVVVATRYFSTATTAMTAINKNKNTIIKKVFCFGDSLTAGTSPPYERELFPYATYLEEALRTRSTSTNANTNIADADAANIDNNESNDNDNDNNACHLPEYTSVVVRWKGFPGWQASTLRDDGGLATIISNLIVKRGDDDEQPPPPPPLDLILILAGTNDLAYEDDSSMIFSNIQGIHKIAHSYGCKTIALGIPPSGWQLQDSNKAGNIADEVNEKLQSWCCDNDVDGSSSSTASSSCSTMVTYVPFPIKKFDRDSGLWAPDGLHLSPEGYKTIGVSLSPIIANILNLC